MNEFLLFATGLTIGTSCGWFLSQFTVVESYRRQVKEMLVHNITFMREILEIVNEEDGKEPILSPIQFKKKK